MAPHVYNQTSSHNHDVVVGDMIMDFKFSDGTEGLAVWDGGQWLKSQALHHIEVGDQVMINGTPFILTEFAQYHDSNPMATLTSTADLLELNKED